jgi:hypothetical protein
MGKMTNLHVVIILHFSVKMNPQQEIKELKQKLRKMVTLVKYYRARDVTRELIIDNFMADLTEFIDQDENPPLFPFDEKDDSFLPHPIPNDEKEMKFHKDGNGTPRMKNCKRVKRVRRIAGKISLNDRVKNSTRNAPKKAKRPLTKINTQLSDVNLNDCPNTAKTII